MHYFLNFNFNNIKTSNTLVSAFFPAFQPSNTYGWSACIKFLIWSSGWYFHHHQHALVSLQKRLLCKNQLLQFECSEPLIRHLEKRPLWSPLSTLKGSDLCLSPRRAAPLLCLQLLVWTHSYWSHASIQHIIVWLVFFISFFGLFVRIFLDFCNSRNVFIQLGDSATERDLQVIIDKLNRKISMELHVCFLLVIILTRNIHIKLSIVIKHYVFLQRFF